ncbi:MAG: class III poly(R)-hydroxyalkanoic acid synthase subunit PhaC [Pseudomonadota bacterium]
MDKSGLHIPPEEMLEFTQSIGVAFSKILELGDVKAGSVPRELVYTKDKLSLYRYQSRRGASANRVPILIVYALVNRPDILDLQKGRSTIESLVQNGHDVYLIDWGYPEGDDKGLTLDDYICRYVDACVDYIRDQLDIEKVDILGVCQGGVFSLCYAALFADKVRNLVTMVTPVDFKTSDNLLSHWVQNVDVDLLVDSLGNIPGEMLKWLFINFRPNGLTAQKYLSTIDIADDKEALENFLLMEKWISDCPDQAGETFRQFVKDLFQENKLALGEFKVGGRVVDLRKIDLPVLNVFAEKDHLVPPESSRALKNLLGTDDYSELPFDGGHIGIFVSKKSLGEVTPAISQWLKEHFSNEKTET